MARYTGPKTKIARRFRDPIFGADKALDRRNYGPGQHGPSKKEEENNQNMQFNWVKSKKLNILMEF